MKKISLMLLCCFDVDIDVVIVVVLTILCWLLETAI